MICCSIVSEAGIEEITLLTCAIILSSSIADLKVHRVTKQTKLIAFQYKIIHNVLPYQVNLFHAGITENTTCPLCSCEKQTTPHMLFNCTKSTAIWNSLVKWWHQKFNQIVDLKECIILYGWLKNTLYNSLLNYALLVAKYHIFVTTTCNGFLDFDSFLLRLKNDISVLREISFQNQTGDKFESTWARLL